MEKNVIYQSGAWQIRRQPSTGTFVPYRRRAPLSGGGWERVGWKDIPAGYSHEFQCIRIALERLQHELSDA